MDKNEEKIIRNFSARSKEDQQAFIENTWCDTCQKENLGLHTPIEYEHDGVIYIEGKCNHCDKSVVTEFTEEDF